MITDLKIELLKWIFDNYVRNGINNYELDNTNMKYVADSLCNIGLLNRHYMNDINCCKLTPKGCAFMELYGEDTETMKRHLESMVEQFWINSKYK